MRRYLVAFFALLMVGMLAAPVLSAGSGGPVIVAGGQEHWMPGTGAMKGVQIAALSGDPTKSGPYVVRIKIPPNTQLPAHYHADVENVTVISGTFYVGVGDKLDATKLTALKAGTFVHLPSGVHHYAVTKADGAVVQINGSGPMTMTMVSQKKM